MQILGLNKFKKKAFSLIEVILALGIISIIAIFIFPSLTSLLKNSQSNKEDALIIFALEEAIEVNKKMDIDNFTYTSGQIDVDVEITDYHIEGFKEIKARYDDKELFLLVEK